jgi:hypothetical protein
VKKGGPIALVINTFFKLVNVVLSILQTPEIMYYILLMVFGYLGIVKHQFFYIFHLTEIIVRVETLKDVLKSIWFPAEAIILTLVMLAICIYFFTIWAFLYFPYTERR